MRESNALSIGSFLMGLGLGWLFSTSFEITKNLLAWGIIVAGIGIVISALLSFLNLRIPIHSFIGALSGGIIISLILSSGLGYFVGFGVDSWGYTATGIESFSGSITLDNIYLEVDIVNGPIKVSTWNKNEYSINVTIKAKGPSQADAEDNLNDLNILFEESLLQDQMRLVIGHSIPFLSESRYILEVDAFLPGNAMINLKLDSSNGGISLAQINGIVLEMETSNGRLNLEDVYAKNISGRTSNGRIDGKIEAEIVDLSTSNSRIDVEIPSSITGDYSFHTSNGAIKLTVGFFPRVGYDLDLSTSNGDIDIAIPGLEYGENQRTNKEAQTKGFEDKSVQITIVAYTSNSDIDLEIDQSIIYI